MTHLVEIIPRGSFLLAYKMNVIATDALATQGARASTAMILIQFVRDNLYRACLGSYQWMV